MRLVWLSIVLCVLVLLSVPLMRVVYEKPIFPAGESYQTIRMADSISKGVFADKFHPGLGIDANEYALAFLERFLFPEMAAMILTLILGLLSAAMMALILKTVNCNDKLIAGSILVLACTPAFITAYTGLYALSFSTVFALAAIAIIIQPNQWRVFGLAFFVIVGAQSLVLLFLTVLIAVLLSSLKSTRPFSVLIMGIISGIAAYVINPRTDVKPDLVIDTQQSLSLLGGMSGYDFFIIVLSALGLVFMWSHHKKRLYHFASIGLFILGLVFFEARLLMAFVMPAYCAYGIVALERRKWELDFVKTGFAILILCALVFSSVNQVRGLVSKEPDSHMKVALEFVKEGDGKVLTIREYEELVHYFAAKEVVESDDALSMIFNSSRVSDVRPTLDEQDVIFIVVTPEMKDRLWQDREQQFLLILRNSESFTLRYDYLGIEIFEYSART